MDVNKIIAQNVKNCVKKERLTLDAASEIPACHAACLRRLKGVM